MNGPRPWLAPPDHQQRDRHERRARSPRPETQRRPHQKRQRQIQQSGHRPHLLRRASNTMTQTTSSPNARTPLRARTRAAPGSIPCRSPPRSRQPARWSAWRGRSRRTASAIAASSRSPPTQSTSRKRHRGKRKKRRKKYREEQKNADVSHAEGQPPLEGLRTHTAPIRASLTLLTDQHSTIPSGTPPCSSANRCTGKTAGRMIHQQRAGASSSAARRSSRAARGPRWDSG